MGDGASPFGPEYPAGHGAEGKHIDAKNDPTQQVEEVAMQHAVLLVDDDQNLLRGLARALRHQPYRLYTTTSGEEAQAILKSHSVHVVVSDEAMPGMRGTDLLAWVAEHYPDVIRIMLTGQPSVESAIRAINEGAVYQFFTKPCNPVDLAIAIRKALEHADLAAEGTR
jgi:DNA-binding NtrC family response regulator